MRHLGEAIVNDTLIRISPNAYNRNEGMNGVTTSHYQHSALGTFEISYATPRRSAAPLTVPNVL